VGEVGHHRALDLVVVRGPQVEGLVLALCRQRRADVGRRDEQDALLGEDRVGHPRAALEQLVPITDTILGSAASLVARPAALLGAGLVAVDQLDVVAHELAGLTVQVVDGQNHAPLAVDEEAPGVAGDRRQGPDLDRLALRHRQTADWSSAVQSLR
jgi:hypothetical protein